MPAAPLQGQLVQFQEPRSAKHGSTICRFRCRPILTLNCAEYFNLNNVASGYPISGIPMIHVTGTNGKVDMESDIVHYEFAVVIGLVVGREVYQ